MLVCLVIVRIWMETSVFGINRRACYALVLLLVGCGCGSADLPPHTFTCNSSLKEEYHNFFYSFMGFLGHNTWWEKHRNGWFRPKNGPKLQN